MAAKQKNIFTRSKPLMNIYSGVDHEGKEVRQSGRLKHNTPKKYNF